MKALNLGLTFSEIEFIETLPSLPDLNFKVIDSDEDRVSTLKFVNDYAYRLRQISALIVEIESKIDSDLDYHHLLNSLVTLNNTKNIIKSVKMLRNDRLYKKSKPSNKVVHHEDANASPELYYNHNLADQGSGLDSTKYS